MRTQSICLALVTVLPCATVSAQWVQSKVFADSSVACLALSGQNVFAGNWAGVFLSTDNGSGWTAVNSGLSNTNVYALGANSTTIFAGTTDGVFLSTTNGTSWTRISAGLPSTPFRAFAVNGANIYAGTDNYGVYLSTDNGTNWTAANAGLMNVGIRCLAANGPSLFAGTWGGGGVYFSSNNGASWAAVNSGLTTSMILALAAPGPSLFAATFIGVFMSTNNGTSWSAVNSGLTSFNVRALAVNGANLFAGTNGGVFLSTNNGTSWAPVNAGLTHMTIYALAISGANLYAATNGGAARRSLYDFMFVISPQNDAGGISTQANFKWKLNPQALAYAFQISLDPSFASFVVNQYTTDTSYTVSGISPATIYYWRVRAENTSWASEWAGGRFTTKMTIAPQLLSPSSGATFVSRSPALTWSPVVSTASYTIQVSPRSSFDMIVFDKDTISTSVIVQQLQGWTTYYWRVRAQTPGDTTAWSLAYSFTTVPNAPYSIQLLYPDSAKQDVFQNDWLLWQADPVAASYLVEISQSPLFNVIYDSATVGSAGYRNSGRPFAQGSTYFWRVRGSNISGDGQFSPVWSFKAGSALRKAITTYSASNIAFGKVKVGQFKDIGLAVTNNGNDTLKTTSLSSTNQTFVVNRLALTIPPSGSIVETIRFNATTPGNAPGSIIIASNAPSSPDTIKVSAFASTYGLRLAEASIDFGKVKLGQYRDTTITITSTGNDTLLISAITSIGGGFSNRPAVLSVAPSSTAQDTIRFNATTPGLASGYAVITSNAASSPDTIKVVGFGVRYEMAVDLKTIAFAPTNIGRFTDTVVTINNRGNDTLRVSNVSSTSNMFVPRPLRLDIAPNSSARDTIRFAPNLRGTASGYIILMSNAPSSPDSIKVSGLCTNNSLTTNVRRIDIGFVMVGQYKDTTFTITNTGGDTLKISSVNSTAPSVSVRAPALVVPPGESFVDTLRFSPSTVGVVSSFLLITSNATTSPDTVKVSGSGVTATTGITTLDRIPREYKLVQNYPNPFNPSTTIYYELPKTTYVSLRIFNVLGQVVATLVDERKEAGYYQAAWNANVPSGIYFYRLQAGEFVETHKMVLLR